MKRKQELITEQYYHVLNKSIAKFRIFNIEQNFQRMMYAIRYYQTDEQSCPLAQFLRSESVGKMGIDYCLFNLSKHGNHLVEILSYCLMPTHVHLLVKQLCDGGISVFMGNTLNSYARYFNKKHNRKGPLWVGRFKGILIEDDNLLLHVSRYIHLNPATSNLVRKPEDWIYSSYKEYTRGVDLNKRITCKNDIIGMYGSKYRKFVESQIDYQRELSSFKHLLLE